MMRHTNIWKYAAGACCLLLLAFTLFMIAGPYDGIIVITDSMRPSIPKWSFVLVSPVLPEQLAAGDVILFYAQEQAVLVLHRLVEIDAANQLLMTKGDTNHQADLFPTAWEMLRGRYVAHVPLVGWLVFYAKQYAMLLVFTSLSLLLALIGSGWTSRKDTPQ